MLAASSTLVSFVVNMCEALSDPLTSCFLFSYREPLVRFGSLQPKCPEFSRAGNRGLEPQEKETHQHRDQHPRGLREEFLGGQWGFYFSWTWDCVVLTLGAVSHGPFGCLYRCGENKTTQTERVCPGLRRELYGTGGSCRRTQELHRQGRAEDGEQRHPGRT